MTPERYAELTRLCQAAMELNASQRAAFLTQACAGDDALRAEIEALLAADEGQNSFFDSPALEVAAQIFAREQPALAGQRLGNYQILEQLGAGGMGEVYLAEDKRLYRKVALKLLPTAFTQDAERVRRFKQEAQAASALNHPNLLTVYDIGESGGLQFIVTEFVEGQTLRQVLQAGPLPPSQVSEIALQLADALAAAHNAGIIHRDIKPENIMRRPDGYVKVLDFGLAKLLGKDEGGRINDEQKQPLHPSSFRLHPLTEPGKVMGTISYMSPEQALGQAVDQRTDIFSLGAVLYELLTGVQPFKFDSEAATYDAILNRRPPALTKSAASVPPELAAIIERALEKDRNLRYQTAADLRAALKRLQRDSSSQSAAAATPVKPLARSVYNRRVMIAAALLGVALAGALLARAWRQPHPANKSARATATALPGNATFNQQTDQPGAEYFPTLSPDGQTLIYASQESGNWDLWKQAVGQRERVNLTKDWAGDDTQPTFAPDGDRIAFRSDREGGGVFVLDLTSRQVKKIVNGGFNPTWSADGAEIAYATVSVTYVEGRAFSQLWAVRMATGEKRLLTAQDAVQPAWSPSGKRIAFWGEDQNHRANLRTIPASGGPPINVTSDTAVNWNPCWSADGKYLYFTSDRGGSMNLWRVAIDETSGQVLSAPEPATTPATDMLHLSIARIGNHLAYVQRPRLRRLQALAFDPVTETVRGAPVFITRGTGFATHPSVSPDGQWLAYSSSLSPQEDIYIIRTDGTGLRQLTNDAAKDRMPRWSPSGERIAFFSDRAGKNEIWAVAPTGDSAVEQLTFVETGRAIYPTWSPDGKTLAYYLIGQGSFLFDFLKPWQQQTPQPISLTGTLEPNLGVWSWSPDGKKLACVKFRPGTQQLSAAVYWLGTFGSAPKLINVAENGDYPAWLSDSRRLVLTVAGKLYLTDLDAQRTREIFAPGPGEMIEYPVVAPNDRTIYYSLASTEADIWIVKQ